MIPRAERQSCHCRVRFTQEDGVTGEGRLLNLSLGGCAVRSPIPVMDGMLISLDLYESADAPPIQVDMARVRWTTGKEFGVEFLFLYENERKRLLRWLRSAFTEKNLHHE